VSTAPAANTAIFKSVPLRSLPLLTLYLTERCNSRCVSCDYWQHGKSDLTIEAVAALLPSLREMNTQLIVLSGGEPLLHPQWAAMASLLRAAGLRLWLLTAGLALAKHANKVAELCESVTVSMDGADAETYRAIRGLDAFDQVCRGVRAMTERRVPTILRVTVQRANFRQLGRLVDLAGDLGVDRISFLAADVRNAAAFGRRTQPQDQLSLSVGDLAEFEHQLARLETTHGHCFASGLIAESPAKLRRLLQYFRALHGAAEFPPVRCNAPEFSAVLQADHRIRPCFFIPGPDADVANLPLSRAINGESMQQLRTAIRAGQRAECVGCVCSMWRDPC
jgi:MoaA/NifB/PqqE/SkfB family radical SAM enzyme